MGLYVASCYTSMWEELVKVVNQAFSVTIVLERIVVLTYVFVFNHRVSIDYLIAGFLTVMPL